MQPLQPKKPNDAAILVRGARVHNLKNIDVEIPHSSLTVITGPSGCGKSSLAFDTIHAEGQRRYVESFSTYARQFLEQVDKPDVDELTGLSPTIAILQKTTSHNPRSTVGTATEINDYLRVLYARVAVAHCPNCNKPIRSQSAQQIVDSIQSLPTGTKLTILAPVAKEKKGEFQKELLGFRQKGFTRARIDGAFKDLSEDIKLDKNYKHSIDLSIDRLILKDSASTSSSRLHESVELALKLGKGNIILLRHLAGDKNEEESLSQHFACPDCGISMPEPEPRTFSFNSPIGACPKCEGLGTLDEIVDPEDEDPSDDEAFDFHITTPCKECDGTRLSRNSRAFKIGRNSITDISRMDLGTAKKWITDLKLSERELRIARGMIKEIKERLQFLSGVGVDYLSLDRPLKTLSGGESQRIRLASQLGSSLVGITYILDEPSIGLHPRDNSLLIGSLKRLRDLGNTVIVVEHDEEMMRASDFMLDIGPGAGVHGGRVVASGPIASFLKDKKSVTANYLSGRISQTHHRHRRKPNPKEILHIEGACGNNLKDISINIPMGLMTCITGVSGSGKSTLIMDTLVPLLAEKLYRAEIPKNLGTIRYAKDSIDRLVRVDQSPIGRTPRSNPATYTQVFTHIRQLFAQLPDSKLRGFTPGRFSFNVKGGRCDECNGDGVRKFSMSFMPDVQVTCDQCKGTRFKGDTLQVRYKGKSIADVLAMSVEEALPFFEAIPQIAMRIRFMNEVGLGYLKLGQSSTTLSGGESQRIKLSRELSKRATGKTVYVLDEPSTGLHFDDISKLLEILHKLVDQGNTVLVIEHNIDIIAASDWILDLGPEAGADGGKVVAEGSPEAISKIKASKIAPFLAAVLKNTS
jgi:excinuclease ABC subunit A